MAPTDIVITVIVILAGLWELFALFTGRAKTFSRAFQAIGLKAPFLAFVVGFLCGHWFAYMPPEPASNGKPVQEILEQGIDREVK